jgi:hypothetical protein
MIATVVLDGHAHTLGRRASVMLQWIIEIEDRLENTSAFELSFRCNEGGKVFADFREQLGVKRIAEPPF